MKTRQSQLNVTNRITRSVIGAGLIGITMAASGPLGYLALLPLIAIYPLTTAMLGEDPVDGLVTRWLGGYGDHCFRPSTRLALLAVGAGAIGVVMGSTQGLASLGIIALLSVYPIMAGLFGEDLFTAAITGQGRVKPSQAETAQPVVGIKHRQGTVHHHGFGHGHGSHHRAA
jgi:hypothetical protein